MEDPEDSSPFWGPLNERGWALQEWYLARGALYFMPAGMSWKCRELETSERRLADLQQYPDWTSILESYSRRQLTKMTDRLVTLEGLARAIQEAEKRQYALGVFESELPQQLLWMV